MTNCIFFAVIVYFRRWRKTLGTDKTCSDYLIIRRSRVRWGLVHVLHGRMDRKGNIRVISFKPNKPQKTGFEPIFRGKIKRGD